jgi:hypothetical protein
MARKLRKKSKKKNKEKEQKEHISLEDDLTSRKIKKRRRKRKPVREINKEPHRRKGKLRKKYKNAQCAFLYPTGHRCKRNAVGKSSLCKNHGGSVLIPENAEDGKEVLLIGNSKYDVAHHPLEYINLSREGFSEVEIAATFETSVGVIRKWAEHFKEFATAYEIGTALHEAWWLTRGKANLNNRGFNTSLFKFLTTNKLGYAEKLETKSTNLNVHGVLLVPDKVNEAEWEAANAEDVTDAEIV